MPTDLPPASGTPLTEDEFFAALSAIIDRNYGARVEALLEATGGKVSIIDAFLIYGWGLTGVCSMLSMYGFPAARQAPHFAVSAVERFVLRTLEAEDPGGAGTPEFLARQEEIVRELRRVLADMYDRVSAHLELEDFAEIYAEAVKDFFRTRLQALGYEPPGNLTRAVEDSLGMLAQCNHELSLLIDQEAEKTLGEG